MTDDLGKAAANLAVDNWGKITALDLLLRVTWAEKALASPNPETYMFEVVETICSSMSELDPVEPNLQRIYDEAEQFLRDFEHNVTNRVMQQLQEEGP